MFYIITDNDFTKEHKIQLKELVSAYPHKTIEFINVTDKQIELFIKHENHWWTRHVFYRLLAAELLPQSAHVALYLDCDIIVRHPLDSLWHTDLTDKAVGCVADGMEGTIEFYNRLEYTSDKGYFNSGVLLMNLTYWRKHAVTEIFSKYIQQNGEKLKHPDQDVLNVVFKDSKVQLPLTYNFQSAFLYKKEFQMMDFTKYHHEISKTLADPIILHLSGTRPWIKGRLKHPFASEFFKYRDKTIWKDEPLWRNNKTLRKRLIDALRPLGKKIGVCSEIPDYFERSINLKI